MALMSSMSASVFIQGCVLLSLCTATSGLVTSTQIQSRVVPEAGKKTALLQDFENDLEGETTSGYLDLDLADTKVKDWIWMIGIPISLVGSTMTVAGLMIQKLTFESDDDEDLEDKPQRTYYCLNWMWAGGFALFASGNMITWVAIGLAPNSVLSVFNSWNIILTLIIAPKIFKNEHVSQRTIYCAGVLVIGCCWVAVAGPRSYRLETIHHLGLLYSYPAFRVCSFCLVCVYLCCLWKYFQVRTERSWDTFTVAMIALLAAISASYATIFSKCSSTLFQSSMVTDHNQIHGVFWVFVVATFFCGLAQIHFLNEGLSHGEASFVIPLYESTAMGIQIVVGGMLFQEYAKFSFWNHCAFWPGVCLVIGGIIMLTKFKAEDMAQLKEELAARELALEETAPEKKSKKAPYVSSNASSKDEGKVVEEEVSY